MGERVMGKAWGKTCAEQGKHGERAQGKGPGERVPRKRNMEQGELRRELQGRGMQCRGSVGERAHSAGGGKWGRVAWCWVECRGKGSEGAWGKRCMEHRERDT